VNHNLARLLAVGALTGMLAAGCSGSRTAQSPVPPMSPVAQSPMQLLIVPDACGKAVKITINPAGGTLRLPTCNTYGGTIGYPSNNAPPNTTITIKTFTRLSGVPKPSGHKVLAYVQATGNGSGSIQFSNGTASSTLVGVGIVTTKTYSLYAYAFGIMVPGFPKSIGRPTQNGKITFNSPLSGENVPQGITVTFELTTP
jgi:hypothetical protein